MYSWKDLNVEKGISQSATRIWFRTTDSSKPLKNWALSMGILFIKYVTCNIWIGTTNIVTSKLSSLIIEVRIRRQTNRHVDKRRHGNTLPPEGAVVYLDLNSNSSNLAPLYMYNGHAQSVCVYPNCLIDSQVLRVSPILMPKMAIGTTVSIKKKNQPC